MNQFNQLTGVIALDAQEMTSINGGVGEGLGPWAPWIAVAFWLWDNRSDIAAGYAKGAQDAIKSFP